jgi:hypothetical protein
VGRSGVGAPKIVDDILTNGGQEGKRMTPAEFDRREARRLVRRSRELARDGWMISARKCLETAMRYRKRAVDWERKMTEALEARREK